MSTHQQLLYHIVFSTKKRKFLLQQDEFRSGVFSYLAATVTKLGGTSIQVGGYYDHVHLLIRIPPKFSVADFIGRIKASCSKMINQKNSLHSKFEWQDGYGAFSVSSSLVDVVRNYIKNQLQHHQKQTFKEEYVSILKKHQVEYESRYLFD